MMAMPALPPEWEMKPLKRVATLNPEVLSEKTDPDFLMQYADISSVSLESGIEATETLRFEKAPSRARRIVRHGDTIVSTVRTYLKAIAPVLTPPENLVVSTGFTVVRPMPGIDPGFLSWVCRSEPFVHEVVAYSDGVSYPAIAPTVLSRLHVPVPPADEQQAIADFLDREVSLIDALSADYRQLLETLEEKRWKVVAEAVTKGINPVVQMKDCGVKWIGDVPKHWEVKRIKYLVRTIEQGWSPQCEGFPVESSEDWGVLKVGCVNGGTFNPGENKTLPVDLNPIPELGIVAGDLLVSRANTRELVGSAAVAHTDHPNLMLCDKLYRLRLLPNKCLPEFLGRYLGTDAAREQIELSATGASSSMLNIGQSVILEMAVPVPPPTEQSDIITFLVQEDANFDSLSTDAKHAIARLKERRAALITAAVTGQIDVRTRNAAAMEAA